MNTKLIMRVLILCGALLLTLAGLAACQPGLAPLGTLSPVKEASLIKYPNVKAKLAAGEALKVMPMGGSVVEGFCDRPSQCNWPEEFETPKGKSVEACSWTNNHANPNAVGFRGFLRDKLTAEGVDMEYVGSVEVVQGLAHEGHFAFTTDDLDYCVQNAGWLEQAQPDMILLLTGADDAAWGEKPAEMLANLETLIGHIYEKLPERIEVIIAQYPPTRDEAYGGWMPDTTINIKKILAEYNAGIPGVVEKLRADGRHVSYVSMDSVFQAKDEYDQLGFHPRAVAAERMAQTWLEKIMEVLDKPVMVSASPLLQPTPIVQPPPPPKYYVAAPLRIMPLGDGGIEGACDKSSNCIHPENMSFPRDGGSLGSCQTNWNTLNPGERGFREFLRNKLVSAGVNTTYVGSVQVTDGLAHEGHYAFTIPDLDYCIQNAKWLERTKPDLILLYAGGVDVFLGSPPQEVLQDLEELLTRIYLELPETTEVMVPQTFTGRGGIHIEYNDPEKPLFSDLLDEYNAGIPPIVDQFRAEGKHVSLVDMRNAVESSDEYDEGGGYPNSVAAERMAQIWYDKIMEILEQQQ